MPSPIRSWGDGPNRPTPDQFTATGAGATAGAGRMAFVSNTGRAACNVALFGLGAADAAWLHRIDSAHGNPFGLWQTMGSPPFSTPTQVTQLKSASQSTASPLRLAGAKTLTLSVESNALQALVF